MTSYAPANRAPASLCCPSRAAEHATLIRWDAARSWSPRRRNPINAFCEHAAACLQTLTVEKAGLAERGPAPVHMKGCSDLLGKRDSFLQQHARRQKLLLFEFEDG